MKALIILIIVIIIIILLSYRKNLNADKHELKSIPLEDKFKIIRKLLNDHYFNGNASVSIVDQRSFNLYQKPSNKIITFNYSTGILTITLRFKYFEKEMVSKKDFDSARNLSLFEQQTIAERFIKHSDQLIGLHKNNVLDEGNQEGLSTSLHEKINTTRESFTGSITKKKIGNKISLPSNNYKIDCDNGYYLHQYRGYGVNGNYIEYDSFLVFINDKYVQYISGEPDEYSLDLERYNRAKKYSTDLINNSHQNSKEILNEFLGTYKCENEKVELFFFDPMNETNVKFDKPKIYKKLVGRIEKNTLLLDVFKGVYDYKAKAFTELENELLSNSKFIFQNLSDSKKEEIYINLEDEYKKIVLVFYQFCFDVENAKSILGNDSTPGVIALLMMKTTSYKDSITLNLLSKHAEAHEIDIQINNYPNQYYNNLNFQTLVERVLLDSKEDYLEILSIVFPSFIPEDKPLSTASNFIIHVHNGYPKSIYVVVENSFSSGFILRKVSQNGISSNVGSISDNEIQTIVNFITNKIN